MPVVLEVVSADDNADEMGMRCKVNMFGERGHAQNRRRQASEDSGCYSGLHYDYFSFIYI